MIFGFRGAATRMTGSRWGRRRLLIRSRQALAAVGLLVLASCENPQRGAPIKVTDPSKRVHLSSARALPTQVGAVVVGEVENRWSGPVTAVMVFAKIRDRSGRELGEQFGFTLLEVIPSRAKAPFSIPFIKGRRLQVGSVETHLKAREGGTDTTSFLVVTRSQGQRARRQYEVSGFIRNAYGARLRFPRVIATFYGADGRVVGAGVAFLEQELMSPGEVAPFRILLPERQSRVARYKLVTEAKTL